MFAKPVICSNVGAMADRVTNERDGLHFEMGDPAALARTIKRAATEPGLWPRLAGALPSPPSRAEMADGFRRIYQPMSGHAASLGEGGLSMDVGEGARESRKKRK